MELNDNKKIPSKCDLRDVPDLINLVSVTWASTINCRVINWQVLRTHPAAQ